YPYDYRVHHFSFLFLLPSLPPPSTLFPYTTLFRSSLSRKYECGFRHSYNLIAFKDLRIGAPSLPMSLRRRMQSAEQGFPLLSCRDRKSTRLNSSHVKISYAVFCLKKKR